MLRLDLQVQCVALLQQAIDAFGEALDFGKGGRLFECDLAEVEVALPDEGLGRLASRSTPATDVRSAWTRSSGSPACTLSLSATATDMMIPGAAALHHAVRWREVAGHRRLARVGLGTEEGGDGDGPKPPGRW